jgi:pimeloyl-ACP methyl ester carboxylesterase
MAGLDVRPQPGSGPLAPGDRVLDGAQDPLLRPAAARRTAAAIRGARLVILPGVGHYLPAAVYPQVADEVRVLADRVAMAAPKPG